MMSFCFGIRAETLPRRTPLLPSLLPPHGSGINGPSMSTPQSFSGVLLSADIRICQA